MSRHRIDNAMEQIKLALPNANAIEALFLQSALNVLRHTYDGGSNDIAVKSFYTVAELSDRWGMSGTNVRHHLGTGHLKGKKHKGQYLVRGRDVALFEMLHRKKEKAPRLRAQRPENNVQVVREKDNSDGNKINRSDHDECYGRAS
jgi:hypothetical protein